MNRKQMLDAIRTDFPSITIESARVIESGWDNDAIDINDELIFRFPKSSDIKLDVEVAVLHLLDGKTSLAIPRIQYLGKALPYIGYRKIPGSELSADRYTVLSADARGRVARDLAGFLFEVHQALPVDHALSLGVPREEPQAYLDEAKTVLPRIDDRAVVEFIAETIDEYASTLGAEGPQSFLYNDLHGDNMAFDAAAGRLNGVFDFGDVAIGDLHRDFSPLYTVHRELLEAVVREYETLSGAMLNLRRIVVHQRLERVTDLGQLIDDPTNPEIARIMRHLRRWMSERDLYRSR